MKTKTHHTLVTIILAALLVPATDALSQDRRDRGVPALTVLNRIASKFGSQTAQKIVRMRGAYGQSQPEEWWVVVHDPTSPTLLREFWIGDGRANNEGPSDEFYPRQTPAGFVSIKNIKLDSVDAFELLNREATKAKMGFDSVNYFLRCREFSSEPVWTLQAVDENRNIARQLTEAGFDVRVGRAGLGVIADLDLSQRRPARGRIMIRADIDECGRN